MDHAPEQPGTPTAIIHQCGNCKGTTQQPSTIALPHAGTGPTFEIVVCPPCKKLLGDGGQP